MTVINILSKDGSKRSTYAAIAGDMVKGYLGERRRKDLLKHNRLEERFLVGYTPADGVFDENSPPEFRQIFGETDPFMSKDARPLLMFFMDMLFSGKIESLLYLDEDNTIPVNSCCYIKETALRIDGEEGAVPSVLIYFYDVEGFAFFVYRIDGPSFNPLISGGTHAKLAGEVQVTGALSYEYTPFVPRAPESKDPPTWKDFAHAALGYSFSLFNLKSFPEEFRRFIFYRNEYDLLSKALFSEDFSQDAVKISSEVMCWMLDAESEDCIYFDGSVSAQTAAAAMTPDEIVSAIYKAVWNRDFVAKPDNWYPLYLLRYFVMGHSCY